MREGKNCCWCGDPRRDGGKMVEGPGVLSCEDCTLLSLTILAEDGDWFEREIARLRARQWPTETATAAAVRFPEPTEKVSENDTLYCTWCGRSQHQVRKLIAGNEVFMCDCCALEAFASLAGNDRAWFDEQVAAARASV